MPITTDTPTALMQFPTASGATVVVTTIASDRTPYTWSCTAGHRDSHPYASLPFCRDDAEAHAAECPAAATSSNPVIAEHHRIERIVSGLRIGESTVINGVPVTAIDLATADLLERYRTASGRYRKLAECGDYEGCEYVRDEMAMCRCQLIAAGVLDLVEAGEHR